VSGYQVASVHSMGELVAIGHRLSLRNICYVCP
jgi:hypothetical protein